MTFQRAIEEPFPQKRFLKVESLRSYELLIIHRTDVEYFFQECRKKIPWYVPLGGTLKRSM